MTAASGKIPGCRGLCTVPCSSRQKLGFPRKVMAIATASASRIPIADYVTGIPAGDRALLARAIPLVESTNPEDGRLAQVVLQELLPKTGNAVRLGMTGVPGVGKSTTIDQLRMKLIADRQLVHVLALH